MERAFKLSNTCGYAIDINTYTKNLQYNNKMIKKLLLDLGIETNEFLLRGNGPVNKPFGKDREKDIELAIVPVGKDEDNLKNILCRNNNSKYRKIRNNTKIIKAVRKYCIEQNIIINVFFPDVSKYLKSLDCMGYTSERFYYKDNWYIKINSINLKTDDNPIGFNEINISEFYSLKEKKSIENNVLL